MPAWDDDDTLVTDPQREISLIYYNNRGGLEDRVFRIKTDRSSATSLPEPRTSHNISNVEIIERRGDMVEVRFNWLTLYYRYQNIDPTSARRSTRSTSPARSRSSRRRRSF